MFFLLANNRTVIKFRIAIVYTFGVFLSGAGFCRLSLVCAAMWNATRHRTVHGHTILLGLVVTVTNLHITVIPTTTALYHTIIVCMRQLLLREYHRLIIIVNVIVIIYMQRR